MKSSSTPPAVVTIAETCLCCISHLNVSLRPEDIRLDVYPRNIVVLSPVSASRHVRCRISIQRSHNEANRIVLPTIPSTILQACPTLEAWKPICCMPSTSSATVTLRALNASKSRPLTGTALSGTGSEGLSTACVAPSGAVPFSTPLVVITNQRSNDLEGEKLMSMFWIRRLGRLIWRLFSRRCLRIVSEYMPKFPQKRLIHDQ